MRWRPWCLGGLVACCAFAPSCSLQISQRHACPQARSRARSYGRVGKEGPRAKVCLRGTSGDRPPGDGDSPTTILGDIGDLALPALGALALDPLLSLVDTIIVGQTDSVGLAAIGLNTFVFTFVFYIFNFLSTASAPLIAEKRGAGDRAEADSLVRSALAIAGSLGVVLFVVLELNAETILTTMGATPSGGTLPAALSFFRLRAFAAPAVLLCSAGNGSFRGRLDTATPFKIAAVANAVNFALDILLVLVLGWGATGAACATDVAEMRRG